MFTYVKKRQVETKRVLVSVSPTHCLLPVVKASLPIPQWKHFEEKKINKTDKFENRKEYQASNHMIYILQFVYQRLAPEG